MSDVNRIGIDLAKNVFELYGVDRREQPVLSRRVRRAQLLPLLANLPACTIVMEACGGAHYWARQMAELGHRPKLIAAWRATRYRDGDKTDYRDAAAICEAGGRARMTFVPIKTVAQQELQALHRGREQLLKQRNAVAGQLRGLLLEFGVTIPEGVAQVRRRVAELLDQPGERWGSDFQWMLAEQYEWLTTLEARLRRYQRQLEHRAQTDPVCQRLTKVEGVGPLVATAFVAAIGQGDEFHRARQVGAWLGLVPKEISSAGRRWLGPITKRGDRYLRTLMIQGARGAVRTAARKDDARHRWVQRLRRQKGFNKAAVALANKNARTLWALVINASEYQPA